jgi:hypothetical protein
MGYSITLQNGKFTFKDEIDGRDLVEKTLKHFRDQFSGHEKGIRTMVDLMKFIGFEVDHESECCPTCGQVRSDRVMNLTGFNGSYHVEKELKFLAPHVKEGSWLEFSGEDGDLFRYIFDGEKLKSIKPVLSWPMEEDEY